MNVHRALRDQRILENMDLVDILGVLLAGDDDYYSPYREDMESAGMVALTEAAGRYEGDTFRAYVRTVVRRAMVLEAQKLDGTTRPRTEQGREFASVDFDHVDIDMLADTPSHVNGVLAKIDRHRSLDPSYRDRERAVPPTLMGAAMGRVADLTGRDREIWVRRRVRNEHPVRVARALDMSPRSLERRERSIMARIGGRRECA